MVSIIKSLLYCVFGLGLHNLQNTRSFNENLSTVLQDNHDLAMFERYFNGLIRLEHKFRVDH